MALFVLHFSSVVDYLGKKYFQCSTDSTAGPERLIVSLLTRLFNRFCVLLGLHLAAAKPKFPQVARREEREGGMSVTHVDVSNWMMSTKVNGINY